MSTDSALDVQTAPAGGTRDNDVNVSLAVKAPKPDQLLGVRHLQVSLLFLSMVLAFTTNVNLSVSIVAMTDSKHANPDYPEYQWDQQTVALILSSYFWGYGITQVPAGVLAQKFGAKPLLVGSLFFTSICSVLTPVAARWGGWGLVVAVRVLQGLSQGFIYPCIHTLLALWSPAEDRGTFATVVYSGASVGTMLALTLGGVLSVSNAGWPSCFYIFGSVGLAWSVVWFFMGSNSPADHPFISQEEIDYIQDSIGQSTTSHRGSVPWRAIFTSLPAWAIFVSYAGSIWGFWTLLSVLPIFLKHALGYDLRENGLLSSLPYLVMFLLCFVFSSASAFINRKHLVSVTMSRKIFNTIGLCGPATFMLCLAYTRDATTAIVLLSAAVGLTSSFVMGCNINQIDLTPNFAGPMMGISNLLGNAMCLTGPLVVGAVVIDYKSFEQWRIIFFIAAGIYFATNAFYVTFATAHMQHWNEPYDENHGAVRDVTGDKRTGNKSQEVEDSF